MEEQVKKTGLSRLHQLREEARSLGITGQLTADEFEAAIKAKKEESQIVEENSDTIIAEEVKKEESNIVEETTESGTISAKEAKKIDARLKYEHEARQKFIRERQIEKDRATIIAESETLEIRIDLPEHPTELELARARVKLGLEKKEVKPSPETIAIESSQKGYYVFTNREQDDAAHTINPGGKYFIHLIPDQIHVLSEAHVKLCRKNAVVPIYERVKVAGPVVEGQMGEQCKRTGGRQRFSFEYLGDAPDDAEFGLVTDTRILDELKQPQFS